jgi:hypothetical protein
MYEQMYQQESSNKLLSLIIRKMLKNITYKYIFV